MAGETEKCTNPLSLVYRVRRISANAQVYIGTSMDWIEESLDDSWEG